MDILKTLKKRRSIISASITIIGVGATVFSAINETPKVKEILEEKSEDGALTKKEKTKTIVTGYKKTIIFGTLTIANIIYNASRDVKEKLMCDAALVASQKMYTNYKKEVKKTIGEEKEKEISENAVISNIAKTPNTIIPDNKYWYYEPYTGRMFPCDKNTFDAAINEVNRLLNLGEFVNIGTFFDELGLEPSKIDDMFGWDQRFEGNFTASLRGHVTEDGKIPANAIHYDVPPEYYGRTY